MSVNFIFFVFLAFKLAFVFLSVLEGPEKRQVQHDFREEDKDESKEVKERQTGNLTFLISSKLPSVPL